MNPDSIPTDFPWREALASMPPWARQMVAMAAGVDEAVFGLSTDEDQASENDETSTSADSGQSSSGDRDTDTPGRGRPSDRRGPGERSTRGQGRHGEGSGPGRSRGGQPGPGRGPSGPFGGMFGPGFDPGGFGQGFGPGLVRALLHGGGGQWPGGRPRASRGDVRTAILSLLLEEAMHGYQLLQEMADRSGGAWRPSPGSVYPTLAQLEDEGLVEGHKDGGRRVFNLTEDGRAAAQQDADGEAPWDSVGERVAERADQTFAGLREEMASTAAAVMAVATSGNPDHIAEAQSMLARTRKDLYRLLAEDD